MRKNIRKILAVALVVAMCAISIGCSLVSVNEEKDRAQVVATIGDIEILKGDYIDEFNEMLTTYRSYGSDPTLDKKQLQQFQDAVLEAMVKTQIMYYQAKQLGMDQFTAEDDAMIEQKVEDQKTTIMGSYRAWVAEDFKDDPTVDVDAIAEEYLLSEVEGYGMTIDEYWESIKEEQYEALLHDRLLDHYTSDVAISDEEVQDWYDNAIVEQQDKFAESPQLYKSYQEYYDKYQDDPVVYVPEGYKRYKHILIVSDDVIEGSYTEKKNQMAALQEELGPLILEDEEGNAERIAEIRAEYEQLKKETDELYAAHYEQAKIDCEALWAELEAGADFHKLMMENTKDINIQDYEIYQENGLLMSEVLSDNVFSAEAKKAALALENIGDYTGVIADDDGYHIFQYVGDEEPGVRPLTDEIKESAHNMLLKDARQAKWDALVDEWEEDDSLVIFNRNAIRDVKGDS